MPDYFGYTHLVKSLLGKYLQDVWTIKCKPISVNQNLIKTLSK